MNSKPDLLSLLLRGDVSSFNSEKLRNLNRTIDFSGRNLTHIQLDFVDFSNCILNDTNFQDSSLKGSNFEGAELRRASFLNTDCYGASFSKAILNGAVFQKDDQYSARGLTDRSFKDSDLRHAMLPKHITFEGIKKAEDIAKGSRNLAYFLIAGTLYGVLLVFNLKDEDFFYSSINDAVLPFISVKAPFWRFNVLFLPLVFLLYLYVHFYLYQVIENVLKLPSFFPDEQSRDEKLNAWILSPLVRSLTNHEFNLKKPGLLSECVATAYVWYAIPFFCLLFTFTCLRFNNWTQDIFNLCMTFGIYGLSTYLHYRTRRLFNLKEKRINYFLIFASLLFICFGITCQVYVGNWSWFPIDISEKKNLFSELDDTEHDKDDTEHDKIKFEEKKVRSQTGRHFPYLNARQTKLQNVDFTGAVLSHANFSGAVLVNSKFTSDQDGKKTNLRFAVFDNATLTSADFSKACLQGASLSRVNATNSVFDFADMRDIKSFSFTGRDQDLETAIIKIAKNGEKAIPFPDFYPSMESVDFSNSSLTNMDFRFLRLKSSIFNGCKSKALLLSYSDLKGASFNDAEMTSLYVNLDYAQLNGSFFVKADFSAASIRNAKLMSSDLSGGIFIGTNFSGSELVRVDFTGAILSNAIFLDTDLTGSDFFKANLCGTIFNDVDLTKCLNLELDQLKQATINEGTLLPPKLEVHRKEIMEFDCFGDQSN